MRYCLALIVGIFIGLVSREKFGLPDAVVTCPDIQIPNCPAVPACPEHSTSNLDTCLKQITSLMQQNTNIMNDKESLSTSLSRCNAEIDYWQERYNTCDGIPPSTENNEENVSFDFSVEPVWNSGR
jgi:hypothetical protein